MLKVGEKPILEHIIDNAKKEGFKNFIISINYLGHIIKNILAQRKVKCKH